MSPKHYWKMQFGFSSQIDFQNGLEFFLLVVILFEYKI